MKPILKSLGRAGASLLLLACGLACSAIMGQSEIESDLAQAFVDISSINQRIAQTQNLIDSRVRDIERRQTADSETMMRTLAGIESQIAAIQEDLGSIKTQLAELRYQARREDAERVAIQVGQGDAASTVVLEARRLLLDASQAMVRREYENARESYNEFLRQFAVSQHRFDAHMGIAESYYREGKWNEAVEAFQRVAERYPADPRAPEALMKIAICQQKAGQKEQAVATLQSLIKTHPNWDRIQQAQDQLNQLTQAEPQLPPPS